jgi:antitoxin YefM
MTNTTITNLRKNLYAYVKQVVTYNDPVHIVTKDGNAVLLSEEEYRGMLATMELMSSQGLAQSLREGMAESPEDCAVYDPEAPW